VGSRRGPASCDGKESRGGTVARASVPRHQGQEHGLGAGIRTYTYGPYGNTLSHTGTAGTALQYDGQYTDAESGLQYLQARYYDPGTGQFLSQDPAVAETGQPYAYSADDPLNLSDPSGYSAVAVCGSYGGTVHIVVGVDVSAEVCEWYGSGGWTATTIAVSAGGGVGLGASPDVAYTEAVDPGANSPTDLQGLSLAVSGTGAFGGGVTGSAGIGIWPFGDVSAEGGVTAELPDASADAGIGYTSVVTSSTGYSSASALIKRIYEEVSPDLDLQSVSAVCGPVISGPDGTDNLGAPPGDGYA